MATAAMSNRNEANSGVATSNYVNQPEGYIPLSVILDTAIQRTYRQLMIMIDM
jgi:hypothetical protein